MGQPLNRLQALRGAACLTIIVYHIWFWAWSWFGTTPPVVGVIRWFGTGALDVFFVLSGFLIPYSQAARMGSGGEARRFLARRFWRIYPTYWVVLGLTAAGFAAFPGVKPTDHDAAHWVAFAALLPPPTGGYPYLGPAYTLTYEVAFYLVFAGVVALPRRAGVAVLAGWAVAVAAALPSFPAAHRYAAVVLSPIVLEILAGYALFELVRAGYTRGGRAAVALGLAWLAGVIVVAAGMPLHEWITLITDRRYEVAAFGPTAVLVVYGLAAAEVRGRRPVSPGWLCRTGDASYSLYLTHGPLSVFGLWLGLQMPPAAAGQLVWFGAMFAVCLAVGVAVHYAAERPFLRLGKRWWPTKTPKAATAAEAAPARRAA